MTRHYALFFLLMLPIALAGIDVEHKCSDFLCIEGTPVTFSMEVYNNLNHTLVIDNFFLIEKNTQEILAFYDEQVFTVPSGELVALNLSKPVEMPNQGFTYYYVPCVNASIKDTNESQFICSQTIRTLTVTPEENVDCIEDEDCEVGYRCLQGRHVCQALDCEDDEAILPHSCMQLSCGPYEVARNHQCEGNNYVIPIFIAVLVIVVVGLIIFFRKDNKSAIVDETGKAKKTYRRRRRRS